MLYAEVIMLDDLTPTIVTGSPERDSCMVLPAKLPVGSLVALVANTHRVVVRVAELAGHGRRLTPADKWRLVQDNFPIGPQLNDDTHIFDGAIFENSAERRCFMMVALPRMVAESIGEMAVEKWGKVHKFARLDTIEHMLFRHFANTCGGKAVHPLKAETPVQLWVVFPQSMGFRILHMNEGLPYGAHYISSHPELREAELGRVWEVATPSHVVILTRNNSDEEWISDFVQGRGLAIEKKPLCCPACFVGEHKAVPTG